jgi:hypothetical protein
VLVDDVDEFLRLFALVTLVQAFFIVVSMLSPAYRGWLAGVLVQGGNMELSSAGRPTGLTNGGGAARSGVQALGVYASLERALATRGRARVLWVAGALVITATALVTGRTGLLMSLAFLGMFLLRPRSGQSGVYVAVAACGLAAAAAWPFVHATLEERLPAFDQLSRWALEFFVSGGRTDSVADLQSMPIPPLTQDTFVGTGLVEGRFGNASGSDSGYVQTYFALGLPMTIVLYSTMAAALVSMSAASAVRGRRLALIAMMFVIEVKEPFIFKYVFPFFVLSTLLLEQRTRRDARVVLERAWRAARSRAAPTPPTRVHPVRPWP